MGSWLFHSSVFESGELENRKQRSRHDVTAEFRRRRHKRCMRANKEKSTLIFLWRLSDRLRYHDVVEQHHSISIVSWRLLRASLWLRLIECVGCSRQHHVSSIFPRGHCEEQ
jgi:hypothetical protein